MTNEEIRNLPNFRKLAAEVMASDGPFECRDDSVGDWYAVEPRWDWANSIYRRVYEPELTAERPFSAIDFSGGMYSMVNTNLFFLTSGCSLLGRGYHFHDWKASLREYKPAKKLVPWSIEDWKRERPEWIRHKNGSLLRLTGVYPIGMIYNGSCLGVRPLYEDCTREDGTKFEKEVEA